MSLKIDKKLFDVIVVSSNDGQIKKYKLSKRSIKLFFVSNLILIIVLVLSMIVSVLLYTKYMRVTSLYEKEISINNILKERNFQYKSFLDLSIQKMDKIYQKISSIEYYGNKLLNNMNIPKKNIKNEISFPRYDSILEIDMYDTYFSFIDEKMEQLEKTIPYSYSSYRENENILLSTPSIWPVRGWLSSYFGKRIDPFTQAEKFHEGLDIANNVGLPIKVTANGVVIFSGEKGGYGNVIIVKHNYSLETRYAHLQSSIVSVGQRVKKGELIGYLGNSGRSSGPHLHYEVRKNGIPVNPMNYILK